MLLMGYYYPRRQNNISCFEDYQKKEAVSKVKFLPGSRQGDKKLWVEN
jgi:hypothetical protein